jgi:O-succinylhomoserine sulfhydrylase
MSRNSGFDRQATKDWRLETKLVRGGTLRSEFGETAEAIFNTSGFVYDAAEVAEARFKGEAQGFTYSRLNNPTVAMFEERMRLIEGSEQARATATGMAAVTAALLSQLRAGDHVVAATALFGSCRYLTDTLLPQFGISVTLVEGPNNAAWDKAVRDNTKAFFLETPSNPTLNLVDLEYVCNVAKKAGASIVVDNVFASPLLQKPMEFGADIVVYSGTKHIDGQGRVLGGCVLCSNAFFEKHLNQYMRHTGPAMSPFNAWVLLKGLETMELRVTRMCENAAKIADFLSTQDALQTVLYPFRKDHPQYALARKQMKAGGSVVTFDVKGGRAEAFRLMNALKIIDISNNLGDSKSLITHPASTTHQRLKPEDRESVGIREGTIRLSIGLENVDDLAEDLAQALKAIS